MIYGLVSFQTGHRSINGNPAITRRKFADFVDVSESLLQRLNERKRARNEGVDEQTTKRREPFQPGRNRTSLRFHGLGIELHTVFGV